MKDYEREVLAAIEEYGFYSSGVFDSDGELSNFAYTVGFPTSLGCADCVVLGLDLKVMHHMLWQVFHQVKAGKALEHGTEWGGLLAGNYVCRSIRVSVDIMLDEYRLRSAEWYWRDELKRDAPFEAYQIVWPGTQQRKYPWDEGCAQQVIDAQPLLGPAP